MPKDTRSRKGLLAAACALLAVVVIAGASIRRVPSGSVGLRPDGPKRAGWAWVFPFTSMPLVAERGDVQVNGVPLRTREGSTLEFDLRLTYAILDRMAPALLADARSRGLDGAVEALARHVLDDVAARNAPDRLLVEPSRIESPLAAALESAGLRVERLSFRSPVAETVARRAATDDARGKARPQPRRVVVVGWDGADWQIALPLIAAGRMPNLARFVREGAWGELRSYDPMFSPLLWTTVATGKTPTEHGIADFLVTDTKTGSRHPITSDMRRTKALWNILGDFDRSSGWIGWWASYPAEAIRGVIVSNWLPSIIARGGGKRAAEVEGVASPPDFLATRTSLLVAPASIPREDVASFFPLDDAEYQDALRDAANPPTQEEESARRKSGKPEPVTPFLMSTLASMRTYHNVALDLVRSGNPFVAAYYEGVDMVGHRFQHYMSPKMEMVSEEEHRRFSRVVEQYYAWQDERLGELVRAAGADTVFVLLSDHGFVSGAARPEGTPPYTHGQPVEWHRPWGILALHGPGIRRGQLPRTSLYDVAPTLLYLAGLPQADDMPGRLIVDAFDRPPAGSDAPPRIASYEATGRPLERVAAKSVDPEAAAEMMANLRALGYVGGDDAGTVPADADARAGGAATDGAETQFYYHRNLAVAHMRQGRWKEAEAELLLANERKPYAKTFAMISEVRASQGRYAEAVLALEEGWEKVGASMEGESLLWIVEMRLLAGDRAGAERDAARWSSKMPTGVRHAVDGRLAEARGDLAGARAAYERALAEDPLLSRATQQLFALLASRGEAATLEPFLLRALREHPRVDAYWDLAGQIALSRGDWGVAAERLRHANELQPDNGTYLGRLASALAASGKREEAKDLLAWIERAPIQPPDAWMAIGGAYDRIGDFSRAVAAFSKARELGLPGPGADIGAALALARAGRVAEARKVLADAQARFPSSEAVRSLSARLGAS